jgi:hypothetical protein
LRRVGASSGHDFLLTDASATTLNAALNRRASTISGLLANELS